ncbi:MAG: nitroreductase family protein [Oscillospiraceae bacterium]|nr:nitroreductase family protein [Oscillospiraceae bacterium]
MDIFETIKTRRSVRTFDDTPLSEEHIEELKRFIPTITNPYNIPVEFVLLDSNKNGLSSPVITGGHMYVAAKVKNVPHSEEAFGYAFEHLVLFAWSLGIGTTWIGGTFKRDVFEKAAGLSEDERMYCASPLGYPAKKMSVKEITMRTAIQADKRRPVSELFFENSFSEPLTKTDSGLADAIESVRLAPSAVNKQPWRVVKCGNAFHFYVKHSRGFIGDRTGDLQKIDVGIALNHFMLLTDGSLTVQDPKISAPDGTEYVATVTL